MDQPISQLPVAQAITGQELTVVVQRGVTKQALVSQVANAISPGKLIVSVQLVGVNLQFNYSDGTSTTLGPVAGIGVPAGGTTGQVLTKLNNTDYATTWTTPIVGTVTSVTGTAPIASSGGTTPAISIPAATTSVSGYLTSTDWNTFNNKQSAGTYVTAVTGTAPIASSGGTTPAISIPAATTSVNGYLTSTDWNTFNNKQTAGTYVTSVSIASSNGFAGSSSGGATPAITLSTTITGLLKGNGTAISAATSGTDYAPATSGTSILYGNGSGGFSNVTIGSNLSFISGTLSASGGGSSLSVADITNNATYYPTFTDATSGTISTINVSSTKMSFNPNTGILTSTAHYATEPSNPGFLSQVSTASGAAYSRWQINGSYAEIGRDGSTGGSYGTANSLFISNLSGNIQFYTAGAQRAGFNNSGAFFVGTSVSNYGTSGQVLTSNGNAAPSWTTVAGTGDVVGPSSATDNAIARFDGTTGKVIQNSVVTINDTTGTMTITGVASRIQGDFSNATQNSRLSFQTSTTDGATTVQALPNGTGNISGFTAYNAGNPTNGSFLQVASNGSASQARINSAALGTGTVYPLVFMTNTVEKFRIGEDAAGTFTFGGTAPRITGDFSNATVASRLAVQTSTTDGETYFQVLPNGTATSSSFTAINNSNPTNASRFSLVALSTEARLSSSIEGTGTYLPMTFSTSGTNKLTIAADTTGTFTFSGTDPKVGIGMASTRPLSVASSATAGAGSAAIYIEGSNNSERFEIRSSVQPTFQGKTCSGTVASPSPTANGQSLFVLGGGGYDSAGWPSYNNAFVRMYAAENWTTTAHGTYVDFATTPLGSISAVQQLKIDTTGNVILPQLGQRIQGDFSNATTSNRVLFQSTTTNGNTSIGAIPNGTSTSSNFAAFAATDPNNSSFVRIRTDGTLSYVESSGNGSGTYLPLTFFSYGLERMRLEADAAARIKTTGAVYNTRVNVTPSGASLTATFDLTLGNNFNCTLTFATTLVMSNLKDGQTGIIVLINTSGYAVSKNSDLNADANFLATVSAPGIYTISYVSGASNVKLSYSQNTNV
jgi:hypothetical protein